MHTDFILKDPKYPAWLKQNLPSSNIKKVFPSIGLNDFRETVINENAVAAAIALVKEIKNFISDLSAPDNNSFINKENRKIFLSLPADFMHFKKGTSLFEVVNYIRKLKPIPDYRTFSSYKHFMFSNVQMEPSDVVFSASSEEGSWNIATMSMRGINSCQSWNSTYRNCLIGSIIDPFVGMIHLESKNRSNQFGKLMLKRCIVRFALSKNNEPFIYLDRMYQTKNAYMLSYFIKVLSKKTNLPVISVDNINPNKTDTSLLNGAFMPITDVRSRLNATFKASYKDWKIPDLRVNTIKNKLNYLSEFE